MPKPYFRSNYAEVKTQFEPPFDNCVCIPLTKGQHALIDAGDFDLVASQKWCFGTGQDNGYAWAAAVEGTRYRSMHRVILNAKTGRVVDHINSNKLDNRRGNLRLCDWSGNSRNRSVNKGKNIKGVLHHKPSGKYYARIYMDGKLKHISSHDCEIEAAIAYDKKAIEVYGDYAKLNFAVAVSDGNQGATK